MTLLRILCRTLCIEVPEEIVHTNSPPSAMRVWTEPWTEDPTPETDTTGNLHPVRLVDDSVI